MKFLEEFQLPVTDPVLVFLLVFSVVFLAPRLLRKIRIPGIVGFILAGLLLGPHGFNIIAPANGMNMFSSFGLLYIMFLVGLEIDLIDFKKHPSRSAVFGALTFLIPLTLGFFVTRYVLGMEVLPALLLSSMFSTHTLISYPIASRLGITKNRVVNTVVGGTIITDTAVLLLLAIIVKMYQGELTLMFWLRMTLLLLSFVAVMVWLVPAVSRWFFKHLEGDGSSQYLYVLTVLFASAFMAELCGIEPMIGAFMAGLALNALIPPSSVLMNRTVFIGNTIFIPFFLISVGMVVDLGVLLNGYDALLIAGVLVLTAEITKYVAAFITQKIYGFTAVERNVLFGLSSSHAAATIALILVGFNMGILNIDMLNGTVLVIFVSCLVSSFVTESAGRKLAKSEARKTVSPEELPHRILVPVSNPDTVKQLIRFAILLRGEKKREPIYPLNVVIGNVDTDEARTEMLQRNAQVESVVNQTVTSDDNLRLITRIDLNVANGINRAIKEMMVTTVVLGWNGQLTTAQTLFGSILENILPKNHQTIYVVRLAHPFAQFRRLVIVVPPNAEFELGYRGWLTQIKTLMHELSARVLFFACGDTLADLRRITTHDRWTGTGFVDYNDFGDFREILNSVYASDLIFWVSARESTLSYHTYLSGLPRQLSRNFSKYSFVILYPEQHPTRHQNTTLRLDGLTKSPIRENLERFSKISRNVKKAITSKKKN